MLFFKSDCLYWNSGKAETDGSAIGVCLVHTKRLGLISQSVKTQ